MTNFTIKICALLVLTITLTVLTSAQPLEQRLDDLARAKLSHLSPGVSILIAKKDKIIYQKAIGVSDLENQIPMQPNDIFRIGSLTKQFTAMAIVKLSEEGKLGLHEDIRKYVPDFLPQSKTIRIEHLLTHTSGIKDRNQIKTFSNVHNLQEKSPRSLIDHFNNEPLAFPPGEKYMYSNLNYILLGYIIEKVSDQSFKNFLTAAFFQPLKMDHTGYDGQEPTLKRIKGYARVNGNYKEAEFLDMQLPYAAGALVSNAQDLHTWYQALFSNGTVSESSLKKSIQPYVLNDGTTSEYGYGLKVEHWNGRTLINHDGIINGFVSYAGYLPKDEMLIIMLTNCDCTGILDDHAKNIFAEILEIMPEQHAIELTKSTLLSYQGQYKFSDDALKCITYQDGQLMLHDKGGMKVNLVPIGQDTFAYGSDGDQIIFDSEGSTHKMARQINNDLVYGLRSGSISALESRTMDQVAAQDYIGKYEFPGAFTFEVVWEDDHLYGQVGNDRKKILPYAEHEFFAVEMDARLIFRPNDQGDIIDLTLVQNQEMTAKRIE